MDTPLSRLKRDALRSKMLVEFERPLDEVVDAVDSAPASRMIRDSEEPARVGLDRFRCRVYEAALQAKVEAAEALSPLRPALRAGASTPYPALNGALKLLCVQRDGRAHPG